MYEKWRYLLFELLCINIPFFALIPVFILLCFFMFVQIRLWNYWFPSSVTFPEYVNMHTSLLLINPSLFIEVISTHLDFTISLIFVVFGYNLKCVHMEQLVNCLFIFTHIFYFFCKIWKALDQINLFSFMFLCRNPAASQLLNLI